MGNWQAAISVEHGKDVVPKIVHDTKRAHWEAIGLLGAKLVTQQFWSKGGGPDTLSTIPAGVITYSTLEGAEIKIAKGFQLLTYGGFVYGKHSAGNRAVGEYTIGFSQDVSKDR